MSKHKIYDQFDSSFKNVTAKAILWNGKHVANINIKHGNRCTAYVHFFMQKMERGFASGGGYDKPTAAVLSGIEKVFKTPPSEYEPDGQRESESWLAFTRVHYDHDDGQGWESILKGAGFQVLNVIA